MCVYVPVCVGGALETMNIFERRTTTEVEKGHLSCKSQGGHAYVKYTKRERERERRTHAHRPKKKLRMPSVVLLRCHVSSVVASLFHNVPTNGCSHNNPRHHHPLQYETHMRYKGYQTRNARRTQDRRQYKRSMGNIGNKASYFYSPPESFLHRNIHKTLTHATMRL